MFEYPLRVRSLFLALICALALPLAGWASGQSRFFEAVPTFSASDRTPAVMVSTRAAGASGKSAALLVELSGRPDNVHARRETILKVTAVDENGVLVRNSRLEVDFGDGRVKRYAFDRRVALKHTWTQKGSYKLQFRLTDSDGGGSRGKMRLRVGSPVRVVFQILGEDAAELDEEAQYRFVALEQERRKVRGMLTVDWGDGTPPTEVSSFEREATLPHTYASTGTYTIKASITTALFGKTTSATFSVKVTETGGAIDLSQATIASNSAQNIASFRITSTVTNVTISGSQICIFHTKAGQWPVKNALEGNPWVAAFVNGKLHAGTYEWLRPGQVCKGITKSNIGAHVKHGPLGGWTPKSGEVSYFWPSTHARLGSTTSNEAGVPFEKKWP